MRYGKRDLSAGIREVNDGKGLNCDRQNLINQTVPDL